MSNQDLLSLVPRQRQGTTSLDTQVDGPLVERERPVVVGLIAAKNPVMALVRTVESLFAGGAGRVVVVNDGSDEPSSREVFEEAESIGAEVIHLPENRGKAHALRVGFMSMSYDESFIIVQVDDDTRAADLTIPTKMITDGKADIVDIRVETVDGTNLISNLQQLSYWLTNATTKRVQDWLRARLWVSGASLMYTSEAAEVMLVQQSITQTEDTEGRFRAVGAGLRVRYCSSTKAQFKTMVPETRAGISKQWARWALGTGQVIQLHGLGGGNVRIAFVHVMAWVIMLAAVAAPILFRIVPLPWMPSLPGQAFLDSLAYGGGVLLGALAWMATFGLVIGTLGAWKLGRISLVFAGLFISLMSLYWAYHAVSGLLRSLKHPTATSLTWEPPKRMESSVLASA